MNKINNKAGQSTRKMADKRHKLSLLFVLIMIGFGLLIALLMLHSTALGIGGLGMFGLVIILRFAMDFMEKKANGLIRAKQRAVRGAKAEEKIGSILDNLGEDYYVIHDITSQYGNIDHVVLSRRGSVFLIETKAHYGRVSVYNSQLLVNGRAPEKNFIAQILRNTYWLRDEIKRAINVEIWITPVVVFTNAFVEPAAPIKGVTIINKKYLMSFIHRPMKVQNSLVWENCERIREMLSISNAVSM